MNDQQKVNEFLKTQKFIVMAVADENGQPRAAPVVIREHDGIRLFTWDSALQTLH